MATTAEIIAKVVQFFTASDKAHLLVNGPASGPGSEVQTEAGLLSTFPYLAANYEPVLLGKREKTKIYASVTNPSHHIYELAFSVLPNDGDTMTLDVLAPGDIPLTIYMLFRDGMNFTGAESEVLIGSNLSDMHANIKVYLSSLYSGETLPFYQVIDNYGMSVLIHTTLTSPSAAINVGGTALNFTFNSNQAGQDIYPIPDQMGQDIIVGSVSLDNYAFQYYQFDGYHWFPKTAVIVPSSGYVYPSATTDTFWLNRVLSNGLVPYGKIGLKITGLGDCSISFSGSSNVDIAIPSGVSGGQTMALLSQVMDLVNTQSIWGTKTFYGIVKHASQVNNDSNGGTILMTRDLLPQEQLFSHHQVRNFPIISVVQVNGTADLLNDGQTFSVNAVAGAYGIGRFTRNINGNPSLSGAPNRVDGQLAFSFIIGSNIQGIANKAIRFRCGVAGTAPPMMDQAPLTGRGFGFEIFYNSTTARVEIRAFAHNGTTLTYSAAPGSPAGALGPAFTLVLSNVAHVMIQSTGAGQVALYGSVGNGIIIPRASMTAICLIASAGPSGANTYAGDYTDFGIVGHTTNAVGVAQVKLIDSIMKLG